MKTKLLTIIMLLCFAVQAFAQNNDMKARMEFEDAETAYQNQDYSKAVTHLESAEKLLGKPTSKTRYLLILALNKRLPVDYEYKDLEKLRSLTKHYIDNYTTDTEKYRDIYDLSNNLNKNFPKNLAEYNQIKQKEAEEFRLVQEKKQQKEKQEAEELKQAQDYVKSFAQKYGGFVTDMSEDEFAKLSSLHQEIVDDVKKRDKSFNYVGSDVMFQYGFSKNAKLNGPFYSLVIKNSRLIAEYYYGFNKSRGHSRTEGEYIFKEIINEVKKNLPTKYYQENDLPFNHWYFFIKVPGLDLSYINFEYNSKNKRYIIVFSSKKLLNETNSEKISKFLELF